MQENIHVSLETSQEDIDRILEKAEAICDTDAADLDQGPDEVDDSDYGRSRRSRSMHENKYALHTVKKNKATAKRRKANKVATKQRRASR